MKQQKKSSWGGKRANSGRKASENKKETVVVRVEVALLHLIKTLKEKHNAGEDVEQLIQGHSNHEEVEKLLERGIELVLERDREHLKNISLISKTKSLENDKKNLNEEITHLKNRIFNCQFLTKNKKQCAREAKVLMNWQGIKIHVCLQHAKNT